METHTLLVDGVVFDPTRKTVEIHDSHGRLFATILIMALAGAASLWISWIGYEKVILGTSEFRGPGVGKSAVIGFFVGPPAFLSCCYALIVAVPRVFDGLPDLTFDREGITDRWLGCGRIPWSDVYKVETWADLDLRHRAKRGSVRLWVGESAHWLRSCSWHVRLNRWLDNLPPGQSQYPDGRLPVPAAHAGCPIDLVTFLWLIAQYKPGAITESIEIDPLNDEFVYKPPDLVARAMRAIYGSRAEEIVEQQRVKTDEFHAAKWQRVREELRGLA